MDKNIISNELSELIEEGKSVLETEYIYEGWHCVDEAKFNIWKTRILSFLELFLEANNASILKIKSMKNDDYEESRICLGIVESIKKHIESGVIKFKEERENNVDEILNLLFKRFHRVVRQLRVRHSKREPLDVNDEYDVQDLLHALLHIYFNDVRAEEWTPSYAGSSARVDFLLKNEKIVIEVKKTRKGLADKEVGNQLIEDIERYKTHPDCEKLICFVYDPEGRIGNPTGIMNDLNERHEGFVNVIIEPNV